MIHVVPDVSPLEVASVAPSIEPAGAVEAVMGITAGVSATSPLLVMVIKAHPMEVSATSL